MPGIGSLEAASAGGLERARERVFRVCQWGLPSKRFNGRTDDPRERLLLMVFGGRKLLGARPAGRRLLNVKRGMPLVGKCQREKVKPRPQQLDDWLGNALQEVLAARVQDSVWAARALALPLLLVRQQDLQKGTHSVSNCWGCFGREPRGNQAWFLIARRVARLAKRLGPMNQSVACRCAKIRRRL